MAKERTMGTTLTLKKKGGEGTDVILRSLISIGELAGEREEIDVTTLDSPNGAKEYISGTVDWGTQDVEGMIDDETQLTKLRSIFDSTETREWEVKTPSKRKITYSAFIKSLTYGEKTTDGMDTFKMTLRISGGVTFTKES